jgi:hypothetical protein
MIVCNPITFFLVLQKFNKFIYSIKFCVAQVADSNKSIASAIFLRVCKNLFFAFNKTLSLIRSSFHLPFDLMAPLNILAYLI